MDSIAIKEAIKQEKICVVRIKNSLQSADREMEFIDYSGESLLDIRNKHFPADVDVVVCLNGEVLSEDDIALCIPIKEDVITFTAKMGDDVLRIIVGVILVILAVIIYAVGWWTGIGAVIGTALLYAGIGLIIGGVVGLLFPPKKPQIPQTGQEYDSSQVYGWNPQTIQQQGLPIPRVYGVNKLYGNIIAAYLENVNDKQYLNSLLCVGMGHIKRLYGYKINDQPIENLQGVEVYARYGNINQEVIPNFSDTKVEYPTSVKVVNGTPYVYTTVGNAFKKLEVDITFPSGLWYANDSGGLDGYSVNLRIEISPAGQNNWTIITYQTQTYTTGAAAHWSSGYWRDNGGTWRERVAGSTDPNSHTEGELDRGVGWFEGKKCYWHWVENTLQIVNQSLDYATVSGAQTSAIRRTYKAEGFAAGQYDIRITNLTGDQTSSRYGDDLYLTSVRETTEDDFEYPRHILVGLRALATDQLSGSLRFSCLSEGHFVRVYDGANWSIAYNNNPAWVAYDILTQPVFYDTWLNEQTVPSGRYIRPSTLNSRLYECTTAGKTGTTEPTWPTTIGNTVADGTAVWTCRAGAAYDGVVRFDGYSPSLFNTYKWKDWADFCDVLVPDGYGGQEKRITFNGVFDAGTSVWEAVMQVCQVGRAVPIWTGSELTVFIDKADDPVQMFTIGNIGQDTFEEAYLPKTDRATEIDIDFINSEKDFTRDIATIFNPDIDSDFGKSQIQLFGLTKQSEVWRAGQRLLAYNQYLEKVISFTAHADAIASTVGDVILVQHDVPQWGFGGRIVSATTNTVTLDREVVIEASKTYVIVIRLADDTRVSKTVTNSPGTYSTLTLATTFATIPSKYDIYSFGEQNIETKPFRITDIQPSQDLNFKISAIEYNATIYNTDLGTPALPTINYSALTPYPPVTNIVLDELLVRGKDGAINDAIDIYFTKPNGDYKHVEIWYDNGGGYKYAGNCSMEYFRLDNVEVNKTYKIAIVTVNNLNAKASIQNSPKAEIYTNGKLDPPSIVSGFTVAAIYDSLEFNWNHIPDADLWGYEIRVGADWNTGTVISGAGVSENKYIWRPTVTGTLNFWIKAIDTSGIYSTTASQANITIQAPAAVTGLSQQVVDNNVLLKWSGVQGTFPIDYFEIRRGDVYATATVIGTVKGTFTAIFEIQSGTYKYWVTAFDTAGLSGTPNSLTASVSQPPDFQLKANWDDDFTGTKTNIVYDSGDDKHYACVNTTETWDEHFINNSNTTIQDFIDDAYTYLMQPVLTTANYQKVFDFGSTIPGTMITAALDYSFLLGTLTITPTISVSNTSATGPWTDYAGVWQVFANNFRWVKVNLAFSGTGQNIATLNNLNTRLSIKLQNDGGMDTVSDANNGKVVSFTKVFADVDSITVTPQGTAARYAIYDFTDIPNPTQFTVYLFDSGGTKVTGNFSWACKGY